MKKRITLGTAIRWLCHNGVVFFVAAALPYSFIDWRWWVLVAVFALLLTAHDWAIEARAEGWE